MWRSVETAEGETYYYNEETNETSWENPNDGGEVVAERTDSEVHSLTLTPRNPTFPWPHPSSPALSVLFPYSTFRTCVL